MRGRRGPFFFFFLLLMMSFEHRASRTKKGEKKETSKDSLYLGLHKGCRGVDAEGEAPSGAPGGDLFF